MNINNILAVKAFDDPLRPAGTLLTHYNSRVSVDPGDGTRYEVQVEGNVLLMCSGEFRTSTERCIYYPGWGFMFPDKPREKMNQHTVAVFRWLASVAFDSDFIEVPPMWQPRQEGGIG